MARKKIPEIHPALRVLAFIAGMTILIALSLYALYLDGLEFTFAGLDVTLIFWAGILVIIAIVGGTLVKSSLMGEWRLD